MTCGCCGQEELMETIHPVQVIVTIVMGLLAWLLYEVNEATK